MIKKTTLFHLFFLIQHVSTFGLSHVYVPRHRAFITTERRETLILSMEKIAETINHFKWFRDVKEQIVERHRSIETIESTRMFREKNTPPSHHSLVLDFNEGATLLMFSTNGILTIIKRPTEATETALNKKIYSGIEQMKGQEING